ncbi:MAG: RNA pseudouridine synthase [Spirochaetaceae bacterium]|nr:RNA pseudouridine synthase [Spirochaetaceae bacterium]
MKSLAVLFENHACMVLNKPAGLPVQGGARVGASLDRILQEQWSPRPLLVHRLDKDTSGLILVAKNREAAARLSRLFTQHRGVSKQYLAVCAGRPPKDSDLIRSALTIGGTEKYAETRYTRLCGDADFSLLAVELGTGRMHQIRRHLAQIGNPILGDDKYGRFALNKELRKSRGLTKLLLHASRLIIPGKHGMGFSLDTSAPLPDYFEPFIRSFRPSYEPPVPEARGRGAEGKVAK